MKRAIVALLVLAFTACAWAQEDGARTYDELITAAQQHLQVRAFSEAEAALERAIKAARTDEERAAAIFTLATSHDRRGDRETAADVLERAVELEGGGDWLMRCLQRLSALADRLRRVDTGRRASERLLEILGPDSPHVPGVRTQLAAFELEAGNHERAAEHLEAVLANAAHEAWHRQARATLAEVQIAQQHYEQALETARVMDDVLQRHRLEMEIAQRLMERDDAERAAEIARSVLAESPGYEPAMRLVYQVAQRQGAVDALRAELRAEADAERPEPALHFLAQIARWEGDQSALLTHLRRLAELRPDDAEVRLDLGSAALEAQRLDEAEAALRAAVEIAPEHRGALNALAEVLVRRGQTDEATALLKRAAGYAPTDPASVRSLDYALRRHSLHHERVSAIEQAREAAGDGTLMAWELAQAYIDLLRYDEATRELLTALRTDGALARGVGMELERLVADEVAGEDVLVAVEEWADGVEGLPDGARLALARVFLAADDRERAADLLEGVAGAGMAVRELALEAEARGDEAFAATLCEMALGMTLRPDERAEVALSLARLQRERGDWRAALVTLEAAPNLAQHPEALLMRAELLTEQARDLDAARDAWQSLLVYAGGEARYAAAAREGMADVLFASGRLDEAEQAYAEIAGDAESPGAPWGDLPPLPPGLLLPGGVPLPEVIGDGASERPARAALRLAEIALRRGDLGEASERFRHVADAHGDTPWANDALERLAFIRENLDGEGGAERRYFEALALQQAGDAAMARDMLLEIAGTRDEPLADDALLALADLRAEQGDPRSAVDALLSVPERFSESLLAPEALLRAAALLRDDLDDVAGAAGALRAVVERYPDSAAAHEARSQLELLPPTRS